MIGHLSEIRLPMLRVDELAELTGRVNQSEQATRTTCNPIRAGQDAHFNRPTDTLFRFI